MHTPLLLIYFALASAFALWSTFSKAGHLMPDHWALLRPELSQVWLLTPFSPGLTEIINIKHHVQNIIFYR